MLCYVLLHGGWYSHCWYKYVPTAAFLVDNNNNHHHWFHDFLYSMNILYYCAVCSMIMSSMYVVWCCFIDTSVHYFVMLLRSGVNIVASRCVSTQSSMVLGSLEFAGQIVMNCVPCDFTAYLDVFAMVCACASST